MVRVLTVSRIGIARGKKRATAGEWLRVETREAACTTIAPLSGHLLAAILGVGDFGSTYPLILV